MVERLTSQEEAHLVAEAFKAGTLVHGVDSDWILTTIRIGITPTTTLISKMGICTAMLADNEDAWWRYHYAHHEGATNEFSSSMGILLSPDTLRHNHSGKLVAIGSFFTSLARGTKMPEIGERHEYPVDRNTRTVHGIPIIYVSGDARWYDEVKLYCISESEKITPDLWKGIVVARKEFGHLARYAKEVGFSSKIPVFSPDLKVLSTNLAEVV